MSATGPQKSQTDQQSTQTTVQGGSGAGSTITGVSGDVIQNDPTLQLATVNGIVDVVKAALSGAGNIAQNAQYSVASQQSNDAQILSSALAAQQQLATAQGTGGASLTYGTDKSIIYGVIGLAAAVVLGLIFFFSRKK